MALLELYEAAQIIRGSAWLQNPKNPLSYDPTMLPKTIGAGD